MDEVLQFGLWGLMGDRGLIGWWGMIGESEQMMVGSSLMAGWQRKNYLLEQKFTC